MTPREIIALFGRPIVLLKVPRKEKRPVAIGWQNTTTADMTEAYVASLNRATNIGILNGAASSHLIAIDWDNLKWAKEFWELNQDLLRPTLITRAKRAGTFWVFIRGPYPDSGKLKVDGVEVGEWRADGMQTIFAGVHPEGVEYTNNKKTPVEIEFSEIIWPEGLTLPWTSKPEPPPVATPETDVHAYLVLKCGRPFHVNPEDGTISKLNQSYFSQRFCLENLIIFELEEGWFFVYRKDTGAWVRVAREVVKKMFKEYWEHLCSDIFPAFASELHHRNTNTFENSIVENIRAVCGKAKVFKPLKRIIHCANGMLRLNIDGTWDLLDFSPDYYSRNPVPINWNEHAEAPMLDAILAPMPEYDSSLFLRYAGNILLGGNVAQSMLIIDGEGGTSKSTLCELVELVMGEINVIEFRAQFLHERFEIGRYIGKTLLTGKDVPGYFLNTSGAQALKKLTGGDPLDPEIKNQMNAPKIRGDFAVLITCNERLLVRLEGAKDVSAWKRRLLIITLTPALKHREVIGDYAKKMFASEAEGVLRRMVEGAFAHLTELEVKAVFNLHPEQIARVDALLAESQSIEMFLRAKVVKSETGGITTDELNKGYSEYCEGQGWEALKIEKVTRELPNKMFQLFGAPLVNTIEDPHNPKKRVRGYRGVAMVDDTDNPPEPPDNDDEMFE